MHPRPRRTFVRGPRPHPRVRLQRCGRLGSAFRSSLRRGRRADAHALPPPGLRRLAVAHPRVRGRRQPPLPRARCAAHFGRRALWFPPFHGRLAFSLRVHPRSGGLLQSPGQRPPALGLRRPRRAPGGRQPGIFNRQLLERPRADGGGAGDPRDHRTGQHPPKTRRHRTALRRRLSRPWGKTRHPAHRQWPAGHALCAGEGRPLVCADPAPLCGGGGRRGVYPSAPQRVHQRGDDGGRPRRDAATSGPRPRPTRPCLMPASAPTQSAAPGSGMTESFRSSVSAAPATKSASWAGSTLFLTGARPSKQRPISVPPWIGWDCGRIVGSIPLMGEKRPTGRANQRS